MQDSTDLLVWLSAAILIGALFPVRRLVRELPPGPVRRRWHFLSVMIFVVIFGYFAYLNGGLGGVNQLAGLATPMVFFLGSCIVLIVCMMSLETAHDVRRIAVLEVKSITDPLLNIFNRRYLDECLAREIGRAKRHGLPLSFLLIDLDHFKSVNDKWGHPVGDIVLVSVAQLCTRSVRAEDMVVRYGGEEIGVIAPDTNAAAARVLAERIRVTIERAVAAPADPATGRGDVQVTVSIGIATLQGGDDAARFVTRADAALYDAKRTGRNRVVFKDV